MHSQEFDVLTIGNAIVDVIAKVDEVFVAREKLVKGSMNLIDEARAEQLYSVMGPATEISGGSAGNTAAGIASFGGTVFGFAVGWASYAADYTRHQPVETSARRVFLYAFIERTMNTYLGACVNLTAADMERSVVEAAKVTYMEGYLYDKPEAKAAFREAAKIARAAGRLTSITLSDSFCVERHRDDWLDLIKSSIDIVFANESEIKSLYKTQNFDGAVTAIHKDCPLAVLTRSEKGSLVVRGDERITVPAHPVEHVVDVTGAGDLFAAGFLFGFTHGKPLRQCAALGSLAAAEVISHTGARPEVNLLQLAQTNGLI